MVSFSVVTNILFFSSIAIVVLKIIFRNDNVVLRLDVRFLLACLLLIVLRLSVPVESPVVNRVPIFRIYPDVYRFLREPLCSMMSISKIEVLKMLWVAGAAVSALWRARNYYLTARRVRSYRTLKNPEYDRTVERINAEYGRKVRFHLVTSKGEAIPCVFGVFRPYIVVPERKYSQKEIYFILKHEMLHYFRGDMAVRALCEILKAVYWWNILIYILSDLVVDMQEINVDFGVVRKLPGIEQLEYSDCLISAARGEDGDRKKNIHTAGFRKGSPSTIHKRISLMLKSLDINGKKTVASLLLSVMIVCLITLCPSVFIFEPYSIVEEDKVGTVGVSEGNIYYVKNSNGTYDVYIDNQYYKTVLEIFDEKIKVYNSPMEVKGND